MSLSLLLCIFGIKAGELVTVTSKGTNFVVDVSLERYQQQAAKPLDPLIAILLQDEDAVCKALTDRAISDQIKQEVLQRWIYAHYNAFAYKAEPKPDDYDGGQMLKPLCPKKSESITLRSGNVITIGDKVSYWDNRDVTFTSSDGVLLTTFKEKEYASPHLWELPNGNIVRYYVEDKSTVAGSADAHGGCSGPYSTVRDYAIDLRTCDGSLLNKFKLAYNGYGEESVSVYSDGRFVTNGYAGRVFSPNLKKVFASYSERADKEIDIDCICRLIHAMHNKRKCVLL